MPTDNPNLPARIDTPRQMHVCQGCGEPFVTARGFAAHADRRHPGEDVISIREWVSGR